MDHEPPVQNTLPGPSPDQELRIHLEGAWEVLERARDRQAALLGSGLLVFYSEQEWAPALSMTLPFLIVGFWRAG